MSVSRLLSLAEILPSGLVPVAPFAASPAEALGAIAAVDVMIAEGWPRRAVAREPGYAVSARALIGATAYEPALLPASTPLVAAGEILPPGPDAILPASSLAASPLGLEAFGTIRPGEGIRRAGQDWPAGRIVVRPGAPIGRMEQALLMTMEVAEVAVRRASLSIDPALPAFICGLLRGWAHALGVAIAPPDRAHLHIEVCAMTEPRLALRPGRFGALRREGESFRLALPPDLAEATGLWHALALPLLAMLSGARLRQFDGRLAGKITSGIGFSELAFLQRDGENWLPLETGDCTFSTLAETEAVALIPAGSEGFAAGAMLPLMPLGGAFSTMRDWSSAP